MQRFWLFVIGLFERFGFFVTHALTSRARRRRLSERASAFRRSVDELNTPWRLASFMEAEFGDGIPLRILTTPRPAIATWARRSGNPADYARFAQVVLDHHGYDTRYVTLIHARVLAGEVVCAFEDPQAGGWFHLSRLGLFGVYPDEWSLYEDVQPGWGLMVVRDSQLRLRALHRRASGKARRGREATSRSPSRGKR